MQVAERTAADKKGGHLCKRSSDGRLLLRESAMVQDQDKKAFEDITKCALNHLPLPTSTRFCTLHCVASRDVEILQDSELTAIRTESITNSKPCSASPFLMSARGVNAGV